MRSLFIYLGVSLLLVFSSKAQHNSAVSDRFTPTNSVLMNPASIADPRPYIDFRLVGLSVQAENNLYFLPGSNLSDAIEAGVEPDKKYHGAVNAEIYAPALVIARGTRSFGFNIRQRNMVYAKSIPYDIAGFIKNGLNYPAQHNQTFEGNNYHLKYMSWAELGLNYAQIIHSNGDVIISGDFSW